MTLQHPPTSDVLAVSGLSQLAWRYDLIVCDVWGVVHNGARAFPEACNALTRFRAGGGTVVLVSNAPRPRHRIAAMLARLGAPDTAFDAIVTSGDLTRKEVAARPGEPVCHIGPPRDHPIYDGLDVTFAEPEDARYIVCTGFDDDGSTTMRRRLQRTTGHF
jgi:ribonucleotide monophosphatase NagD (HAD superfamily)